MGRYKMPPIQTKIEFIPDFVTMKKVWLENGKITCIEFRDLDEVDEFCTRLHIDIGNRIQSMLLMVD